MVFELRLNRWIEGYAEQVSVSPHGNLLLSRGEPGDLHLYSLPAGTDQGSALRGNLDAVEDAAFCGPGAMSLARLGHRGTEGSADNGWFLPQGQGPSPLSPSAALACSLDGTESASFTPGAPRGQLLVKTRGSERSYPIEGKLTSMSFSPDGSLFYYLALQPNGEGTLSRLQVGTGQVTPIASRLDASRSSGPLALSPDGRHAYLALASAGAPNNELRHQPHADRWLKIYEMDLPTGMLRPVVQSAAQDNVAPTLVNGNLYWVRSVVHDSIVTLPLAGGAAKELTPHGELPIWNPDGSEIGYFFGDVRLADAPLDVDDAVVHVDAQGNRTSEPSVIVTGYHEDFPPAWSPDGKWIAFHSHRSPTAVSGYFSPGSTDDVYLRRADDLHAPEIRLTDFGLETGPPFWSPDGQKLIFLSWDRKGTPGISKVWTLTLDTQKGAVLKTEMLPVPKQVLNPRWAMWSPDGKEIALEDDQGAGKRVLWVVRADGSHPEKLFAYEGTTYDGLDWTRDGKSIIFSGLAEDRRLQLFSIARSGGDPKQLTNDSGNLMHPRVSPDGSRIACTRIEQSKQVWRKPLS